MQFISARHAVSTGGRTLPLPAAAATQASRLHTLPAFAHLFCLHTYLPATRADCAFGCLGPPHNTYPTALCAPHHHALLRRSAAFTHAALLHATPAGRTRLRTFRGGTALNTLRHTDASGHFSPAAFYLAHSSLSYTLWSVLAAAVLSVASVTTPAIALFILRWTLATHAEVRLLSYFNYTQHTRACRLHPTLPLTTVLPTYGFTTPCAQHCSPALPPTLFALLIPLDVGTRIEQAHLVFRWFVSPFRAGQHAVQEGWGQRFKHPRHCIPRLLPAPCPHPPRYTYAHCFTAAWRHSSLTWTDLLLPRVQHHLHRNDVSQVDATGLLRTWYAG